MRSNSKKDKDSKRKIRHDTTRQSNARDHTTRQERAHSLDKTDNKTRDKRDHKTGKITTQDKIDHK